MLPSFIKNTVLTHCCQDILNWLIFTIDKDLMAFFHKIKDMHLQDNCMENMSAICAPRMEESKLLYEHQKHNFRFLSQWSHQRSQVSTNWLQGWEIPANHASFINNTMPSIRTANFERDAKPINSKQLVSLLNWLILWKQTI
jgi:hypothetical protein